MNKAKLKSYAPQARKDWARAIAQAGIKHVFCPRPDDDFVTRWQEPIRRSEVLFKETGIEYVWI